MEIAILLDISLHSKSGGSATIYSKICGIDLAGVKISKEIDISDLEGWRQVIFSDKPFGKIAICDGLLMLWLF